MNDPCKTTFVHSARIYLRNVSSQMAGGLIKSRGTGCCVGPSSGPWLVVGGVRHTFEAHSRLVGRNAAVDLDTPSNTYRLKRLSPWICSSTPNSRMSCQDRAFVFAGVREVGLCRKGSIQASALGVPQTKGDKYKQRLNRLHLTNRSSVWSWQLFDAPAHLPTRKLRGVAHQSLVDTVRTIRRISEKSRRRVGGVRSLDPANKSLNPGTSLHGEVCLGVWIGSGPNRRVPVPLIVDEYLCRHLEG